MSKEKSEIVTVSAGKTRGYWVALAGGDKKRAKRLRQAAASQRYQQTSKGKKTIRKYRRSPKMVAWYKNYWHKFKLEVLQTYSAGKPRCVCECGCNTTNVLWLTIDHIGGGGNQHRKTRGVQNFYWWLMKNNYPSGFRVLCFNCNCGCARQSNVIPFPVVELQNKNKVRHDLGSR